MSVERIIPGGRSDAQPRADRDGERANRDAIPVLLDSTLPPTPLKDLLTADGASVCVLSADRVLTETVQQAGGEQYPVYSVESWSGLCAEVKEGRCGIALLDVEAVQGLLPARIAELRALSKALVVLVAAARTDAQDLIGLLSDRKIHRLLMKPAALGITRLLLESAVSRYLELRNRKSEPDEDDVMAALEPDAPRTARWPAWAIATAIGALILGAAIVTTVSRLGAPSEVAGPAGAAIEQASPAGTGDAAASALENPLVAELLVRATLASAAGRLAEPVGDSALDHYQEILRISPDHPRATEGLATLRDTLFARAEAALLDEMPEEAAAMLQQVARAEPDSPRLGFLRSQHQRLTERLAAEAAAEAEAVAAAAATPEAPSELDSLLAIARLRLERGQLSTPEGDSARAYLERATALGADDPRVAELRSEVAAAIADSAESVLAAGDVNRAAALVTEARRLGAAAATLAPLEAQISEAQAQAASERQATLLAAGTERLEQGALLEPAEDSALYYLGTLRAENAEHPDLAGPWQRLTEALAQNAREATATGDWAQAERWIAALERADAEAQGLPALRRELTVARTQAEFLATPVPANDLTLLQAVPPEYPDAAVRNEVEGWVELEFIVGRDGVPRELTVRAAEPQGRFEEAALAAVAQYRYAPFELDGVVYERRAALRIRFALE